jgi:hypothetical protein
MSIHVKRWKFVLIGKMAKFSFVAFLTRASKSLGYFTPSALKLSSSGVIDLTLDTWVN